MKGRSKGATTKPGEGKHGNTQPNRYVGKAIGNGTNERQNARNQVSNPKRTTKPCKCRQEKCTTEFPEATALNQARYYYASKQGADCAAAVRARNPNDKWLAPLYPCPFNTKACQLRKKYQCTGCKKKKLAKSGEGRELVEDSSEEEEEMGKKEEEEEKKEKEESEELEEEEEEEEQEEEMEEEEEEPKRKRRNFDAEEDSKKRTKKKGKRSGGGSSRGGKKMVLGTSTCM